jgi:hypothetical protein
MPAFFYAQTAPAFGVKAALKWERGRKDTGQQVLLKGILAWNHSGLPMYGGWPVVCDKSRYPRHGASCGTRGMDAILLMRQGLSPVDRISSKDKGVLCEHGIRIEVKLRQNP